jgi:hypothetical protein
MQSILAKFFREHNEHDTWWYKLKIKPKASSNLTQDSLSPMHACVGGYIISKLLGWNINARAMGGLD